MPAITPRKLRHGSGAVATAVVGHSGSLSEQCARRPGGDDRAGDHHARSAEALGAVPSCPDSSTRAVAVSIASGSVAAVSTRSGPNRSSARSASDSTSSARGEPLWVTTIWSRCRLQRGQDAVDVLVGHHRDDPDEQSEVELLLQRLRQRRGACRVVRGIDENRWGAPHPLQPARDW